MKERYYVLPDLRALWERRPREDWGLTEHGLLTDALAHYWALPRQGIKSLGVFQKGEALELARRLPLFPEDREGEDVLVVPQDPGPAWSGQRVQNLLTQCGEILRARYELEDRRLLPVPRGCKLPPRLADKYLWFHEEKPAKSIRWLYVAGLGWLSPAEFQRRYGALDDRSPCYPLVVKYRADGVTDQGGYAPLEVEPAGYGISARAVSATRTYPNLASQDTQYLPKTIQDNGRSLTLQGVTWQRTGGGHFTATATYTGTASSSYVTGYTVTADYAGTVSRIALDRVRYVAIFEGAPLEPTLPMLEEALPRSAGGFPWHYVALPAAGLLLVGGGVGTALWVKRRREEGI